MGNNKSKIKSLQREIEVKKKKLEELEEFVELKKEKEKLDKEIDYNTNLESNLRREKGINAVKNVGKMVGLGFKTMSKGINATVKVADSLPGMDVGGGENSKKENTKKKSKKEQGRQDPVRW